MVAPHHECWRFDRRQFPREVGVGKLLECRLPNVQGHLRTLCDDHGNERRRHGPRNRARLELHDGAAINGIAELRHRRVRELQREIDEADGVNNRGEAERARTEARGATSKIR